MAIGFNSTRASDAWRRCRKRNYAMSIQRLFDVVERRGDIGRRVAALVLPISNRPRVTSSCAGKIGLREPGEHTSGPNLASRDNVAHNQTLYDSGNAGTASPCRPYAYPRPRGDRIAVQLNCPCRLLRCASDRRTSRTSGDVRLESAKWTKTDIEPTLPNERV
jgi:hypothetical protein